jgi:hypothetical protein
MVAAGQPEDKLKNFAQGLIKKMQSAKFLSILCCSVPKISDLMELVSVIFDLQYQKL